MAACKNISRKGPAWNMAVDTTHESHQRSLEGPTGCARIIRYMSWSALAGNALAALARSRCRVFNICTRGLRYLWKVNTATYLCCVCSNIKVNRGPGSIFLVFFALLRHTTYTCTGRGGDLIAIALLFAFCAERVQDRNECGLFSNSCRLEISGVIAQWLGKLSF
jgi:hypothetical protein